MRSLFRKQGCPGEDCTGGSPERQGPADLTPEEFRTHPCERPQAPALWGISAFALRILRVRL